MSRKIFVNLPVKDLLASTEFYRALGFEQNQQFSDENAACIVISDDIFVMPLVEKFFATFTKRQVADASAHTETILGLSADSRDEVKDLVHTALAAGGQPANDPIDQSPMYGWSFADPDGHLWEVISMEPSAVQ
jgi:uncharacterized protein